MSRYTSRNRGEGTKPTVGFSCSGLVHPPLTADIFICVCIASLWNPFDFVNVKSAINTLKLCVLGANLINSDFLMSSFTHTHA